MPSLPSPAPASALATPRRRLPGLDVLRGLAIVLVLARHAAPEQVPGGGVVGVVAFFALSGYLITGLIADEVEATGRLRMGRFTLGRVRRLVPALVAMVAGLAIVTLVADPLGDVDELARTVAVAFTYTANLPFDHGSDAIFHLWTLALEEQFYLIWPLFLAFWLRRDRPRTALAIVGVVCAIGAVATVWWLRDAIELAYPLPTSWAGCLVIGAAAQLLTREGAGRLASVRVPQWAGLLAAAALVALAFAPLRGSALTYLVAGPAIALLTCIVVLAWREWRTLPHPALHVATWLGAVSYAAYLWNYLLTLWFDAWMGDWGRVVALAPTLLLAAASWHLLERPILRRRPVARRRPVSAARR